ncbi:MAG: ABC transporter permease [Leptospiraceae bacterium]|nr:ABC transporter permease [Leptospiraceae bacterium]
MILELLKVELKVFFRNPAILFWAFGFPIIIAGILGMAFGSKHENIRKVSIVEQGSSLRTMIESKKVPEGSYTKFIFQNDKQEDAILKMKRGEINLFVTENSSTKEILYHFDPNNNESYLTYLLLRATINWDGKTKQQLQIKAMDSRGTRYIDFLLPGMLALGIMNSCVWGTGYTLIELRIKKLLRRMMATPLPKLVFLFSHILMRFILNSLEFIFLIVFGYLVFDVHLQGSLIALFLTYVAGNYIFSGIAILMSSRTNNVQVGNGLINFITFPMTICSGIFFSYHNFPSWLENIVRYFPLTLLADSIRAIYIEGAGLSQTMQPILIMFVMGSVFLGVGLKIYKWD